MYKRKGDEIRVSNITTSNFKRRSGLFRRIRELRNGDESKKERSVFLEVALKRYIMKQERYVWLITPPLPQKM